MGPGREVRAVSAAGVAAGIRADRTGPAARGAVHPPAGRAVAAVRGEWSGRVAALTLPRMRVGAVAGLSHGGVPRSGRPASLIPRARANLRADTGCALRCHT